MQISLQDGQLEKSIHKLAAAAAAAYTYPRIFRGTPFVIGKKWKRYKCPPSKERINKH